jgi:cellulose synthase/poly-beta-1,6-N-acetylglucosamine synthase-like glycosyltransferase
MWGTVTWEAKPLAQPIQSNSHCKWWWDVVSEEDLISLINEGAETIWQRPGIFLIYTVSAASLLAMYRDQWPFWTSSLRWYKIQIQYFFKHFSDFAQFPTLFRPNLTAYSVARMHLPTYSSLTISMCFGPPITSRSLGTEFFRTLCK